MKNNTRIILLSIISVLIIIVVVVGVTSAFLRPVIETSSVTAVNLNSCANITLTDTGDSINLSNSYPMTKNRALQTTPYTFTVSSTCPDSSGFNLYLATLNTNTLDASNIHYIITSSGTTDILAEGILSDATNGVSDFEDYEIDQLNTGISGTYESIYTLYNGPLSNTETSYDLYLYIDESVTNETMNQTFTVGVAVKAGEYIPPSTLAEACNDGDNLADCITNFYSVSGTEITNIYYHDADLANGAGDNSYRYAGASEDVNNYICFGSTSSTCPSDNLYRIIGVFGNQVKLIKSTSYGNYVWESDWSDQGNTWDSSIKKKIKNTLNTTFLGTLSSTWQNKIATHAFKVGGMGYQNGTARTAYNYEVGNSSSNITDSMKIGLMYVSDYGFATSNSYWTTALPDYSEGAKNSDWIYLGSNEWTISRWAGSNTAFIVGSSGNVVGSRVDSYYAVRPSFYLESSVSYASGSGTATDPIRIN